MWGRVEGGEQRREPSGPESLQAVAQPLGLSGAPVHEASLCEAQRLVQDGVAVSAPNLPALLEDQSPPGL